MICIWILTYLEEVKTMPTPIKLKQGTNYYQPLCYFPIGYIYLWEQIKDRFLLLAGNTYTAGSTGGTSNHSHSAGSLVACYDPQNYYNNALFRVKNVSGGWTLSGYFSEGREWNSGGGDAGRGIEVIGNTESSNNMPPYIVVYGWVKVSN